ncbi:hypothetical protein [Verrucomicrobium spinosum]|uniref:hypothetical protein n=1 Tax=Verrucomicrobium spinosum TaxID=2736 RepID=UPI000946488A|nr:hypothetical protein [Verrucomicrobium spinosum]
MITRFAQLPLEISTKTLLPYAKPGEPIVTMRMLAVGNLSAFRMGGRTNRVFRFEYSRALSCHVLSIPLSLWQMDKLALAREVLDQRLMHSIIVDVEVGGSAAGQPEPSALELRPAPRVPGAPGAPEREGNGSQVVSKDSTVRRCLWTRARWPWCLTSPRCARIQKHPAHKAQAPGRRAPRGPRSGAQPHRNRGVGPCHQERKLGGLCRISGTGLSV